MEMELPVPVLLAAETDTLVGLYKQGPTGMVIVLIGLKWWWGDNDMLWAKEVEDLTGCFEKMLRDREISGNGKHKAIDSSGHKTRTKKAKV